MADVLTNLRELSVAFFLLSDCNDVSNITPQYFSDLCNANIQNCTINNHHISKTKNSFGIEEQKVLNNGLKLSKKIKDVFDLHSITEIQWVGGNTQSDSPVDLIINDYKLSLKEDSFILENMGLYKLLNTISNSNSYNRGLHVFETFSFDELNKWFSITRDILCELPNPQYSYKSGKYTSSAIISNDTLKLFYNEKNKECVCTIKNFSKTTYSEFQSLTNSICREKCFSKWLQTIQNNKNYSQAKRECSMKAGENIVNNFSKYKNIPNKQLLRLFRIHGYTYYYCKTTSNTVEVMKVPTIAESMNKIIISELNYFVPNTQLNLRTKVYNQKNNKSFLFRNELRYSHGQFNGTPEAKLYFDSGSDLSIMYDKI